MNQKIANDHWLPRQPKRLRPAMGRPPAGCPWSPTPHQCTRGSGVVIWQSEIKDCQLARAEFVNDDETLGDVNLVSSGFAFC